MTLLALHQQRLYRRLADDPARADRVVARLGPTLRGEARDIVLARRALGRIRRSGRVPAVRTAAAAPAEELRGIYTSAQRRFRVPRDVLAAVNFVESAFGRVRSASEAGARGPMQFLPATWRQYGLGGDIDKPRDAIFGAANYLRASGAPGDLRRALFAYNRSTDYVSAILRFARRMRADERTFYAFYAWQVYVRTPAGRRRRAVASPDRGRRWPAPWSAPMRVPSVRAWCEPPLMRTARSSWGWRVWLAALKAVIPCQRLMTHRSSPCCRTRRTSRSWP